MDEKIVVEVLKAFRDGAYVACAESATKMLGGPVSHEVVQALLISLQRQGETTNDIGERFVLGLASRPWQQMLMRVTLGEIEGDAAVEAAQGEDARCQAYFYHGTRLATIGEIARAREALDRCLAISSQCIERLVWAGPERARLPKTDQESAALTVVAQIETLMEAAFTLSTANELGQAVILAERALELARGPEHAARRVSVLGSLGTLLHRSDGDAQRVFELFREQFALAAQVHGEHSPELAQASSNVALSLSALGKVAEAESFCARTLRIYLDRYGERHADTCASVGNMALNLRRQGRHQAAADWYARWYDLTSALHGPRSAESLRVLHLVLGMFESAGALDAANSVRAQIAALRDAPDE